MIAAQVFIALAFAPRNAHRGHQGAQKALIFMRQQQHPAQTIKVTLITGTRAQIALSRREGAFPLPDISRFLLIERDGERLHEFRDRTLRTAPKCNA